MSARSRKSVAPPPWLWLAGLSGEWFPVPRAWCVGGGLIILMSSRMSWNPTSSRRTAILWIFEIHVSTAGICIGTPYKQTFGTTGRLLYGRISPRRKMSDEERPPAPPMRLTSGKDSLSPASKPLPSTPVDDKKKKTTSFRFFMNKGDEDKKCM